MHYLYSVIILISLSITWYDVTERRIPNMAIGMLLVTGICFLLTIDNPAAIKGSIVIPLIVFSVGYVLSIANVIGMGDVKLLSAALLLSPLWWQVDMLYFTFFIGGVWGIIWHYLLSRITFIKKVDKVGEGIPYGIPIVVAMCLFTFIK